MKIARITIHNFRSIIDESFNLEDYSLLIGSNNCGKSNIVDAIRLFYEKDGFKYNDECDFPKSACNVSDKEVWIEITYKCTDDEFSSLREEYKLDGNLFTVRKVISTEKKDKNGKSLLGIFAYENGNLSSNNFYGWKNVSQAKLGEIIYIPAISKFDETIKTSGPSPFRDLINNIVKKLIAISPSFDGLGKAVNDFTNKFKEEKTIEGLSFDGLENDISQEIGEWDVKFKLSFNELKEDDIVKTLITHKIWDVGLDDEIKNFGQGLQRNLIFSLIKLSDKYNKNKPVFSEKDVFSPSLTLLLFEEPEVFLHPSQENSLHKKLKEFSNVSDQQVLITTHSPNFVSKNILELKNLIKIKKVSNCTNTYQIDDADVLFAENIDDEFKNLFEKTISKVDDVELSEGIKYFLWLNVERTACFFSEKVLLVEGSTEKCFIDYLIQNGDINVRSKDLYVLDCMGKFNIHRFINLFGNLGIDHYILCDKDNKPLQNNVNHYIQGKFNAYTKGMDFLDPDIEGFIGIDASAKNNDYNKPFNLMYLYRQNPKNFENKIKELEVKLNTLIS